LRIFPKAKTKEEIYGDLLRRWIKIAREEGINITLSKIQEIITLLEDSGHLMLGAMGISEEEETEIHARVLWEILRRDLLTRLTSHVEGEVNLYLFPCDLLLVSGAEIAKKV